MNKNIEIDIRNVHKKYFIGRPNELHVLKEINLQIEKNKLIAIMGKSGSGKSTLLHIIGLLDEPTEGKVLFKGKDVSKLNEKTLANERNSHIGFVFQFFNLHPTLNALENVELPLIIKGVNEKVRREKAIRLLELVGMGERLTHMPQELSGGEQQRVAIARALINDPTIILADEPTGNLDTKTGHEIMELLKNIKKQATVVVITHDRAIAGHADRIIYLRDGLIVRSL